MFSNILSDLDGTLTDPDDGGSIRVRSKFPSKNRTSPGVDQLDWCIGPPLRGSFSRLLNTKDGTLLDQALFHYRKRFSESGMFENVIYPEVIPSLRRIKAAGIRVFLATSKPKVFAKQILDHFNLTQFFNAVYGSELNGHLSDKGELVGHILDTEHLDPKVTLIVGDRSHDIIGGKKNGIMTAAVRYGYGILEELTSSNPDFIFDTLSDLAAFIESETTPNKGLEQTP